MLKVCRDVFLTDSQKVTLLALLDLSAAFDCVDHDILLHRLQSSSGLADKVLDWLRSFLTGRSQQVLRDGCLSELVMILFGVPQGSVIGPILFILHMVEVFDIIAAYGVNCELSLLCVNSLHFTASGSDLYWTAQLRVQRSCSVEQSATSLVRKHVTAYI